MSSVEALRADGFDFFFADFRQRYAISEGACAHRSKPIRNDRLQRGAVIERACADRGNAGHCNRNERSHALESVGADFRYAYGKGNLRLSIIHPGEKLTAAAVEDILLGDGRIFTRLRIDRNDERSGK